jgi:ABC-type branched-subunit amino acid transport system permease subunit
MLGHLDFAAGAAVVTALIAAALFPAVLALLSRLPALRDRDTPQFLASSVIVVAG